MLLLHFQVKRYIQALLFIVVSSLLMADVAAQQGKIDSFILRQMKEQSIMGLSIGIVENGRVYLTKGYGLANAELNVKASEKTVYKIASISKQFVAVGIMRLVQENKLKLNDAVTKFIVNAPESWSAITVRHLLNHTSGLPAEPPGFDSMKNLPDSVFINNSFGNSLAYSTGSKYEYSNFGYFVLAEIIRIISHLSFETYMKEYVFNELGLKNTRTTNAEAIIPDRADGYIMDEHKDVRNAPQIIALRPSGAFLSSVNDLVQYETNMQQEKLLTPSNWNLLFNDTVKTTFTMDDEPIYYAYGWMTNKLPGKQLLHHGGSLPGFKSVYFRFRKEKTAIIILTNSEYADAYQIALGIQDILEK